MSGMQSGMYAGAINNITDTLKWSADRQDKQKQVDIENQRWGMANDRAVESHNMQQKIQQSQLDQAEAKQSLGWIKGAQVALAGGSYGGLETYLKSNPKATEKYGKQFIDMYGSAEDLQKNAEAATKVAQLAKIYTSPESLKVMESEKLFDKSPYKKHGLYFEPAEAFEPKTLAAISMTQSGPKGVRGADAKFLQKDGTYTKYQLNKEGNPMIAGVGISRQGKITTVLRMDKYDTKGNKIGTVDVPSTVNQSGEEGAELSFASQEDFDRRAEGLQIGAIAAHLSGQAARLDPEYAGEELKRVQEGKTAKAAAPYLAQIKTGMSPEAVTKILADAPKPVSDHIGSVIGMSQKLVEPELRRQAAAAEKEKDRQSRLDLARERNGMLLALNRGRGGEAKAESTYVNNFWKNYTLPSDAPSITPADRSNHARVEYLMNEGANKGIQMLQVYDPVSSKYTAMPAKTFVDAAKKAGVKATKDKWGVVNLAGRANAMNALLNATGNKGAYPVSIIHPAYIQSSKQQAQEIADERLQKMSSDNANALLLSE